MNEDLFIAIHEYEEIEQKQYLILLSQLKKNTQEQINFFNKNSRKIIPPH